MKLKYVVTNQGDFAIFTALTNHNDIGFKLHGMPVGAGFCNLEQDVDSGAVDVHCWGESISMDLKSRPEDEGIINRRINN